MSAGDQPPAVRPAAAALCNNSTSREDEELHKGECHRTVGMVFAYRLRGPLPLALNCDDTGCFSDTVSRASGEEREEFYDTP
jgi:hypothetical protein